jgi:glycine cleavage system T protein (aminomethyltransferase)
MTAKKTPLHGWHAAAGANMAVFGQYQMPMWYPAGAKTEHLAVLTAAGLFDTSHMAVLTAAGPGVEDLLQHCFTKDLSRCTGTGRAPLKTGRCAYGAFLDDAGHVMDDAIVYRMGEAHYIIVVNAGMGGIIAGHLTEHASPFPPVDISDLTGQVAKIDLQGPAAARILRDVLDDAQTALTAMPYFSFKGHFDPAAPGSETIRLSDGTPVLLSRTGYTGEFGFEIFIAPDRVVGLWDTLLTAGRNSGLVPCGLAARDSLRTGAVLPLSHQDIGPWPFIHHPWSFALPWDDDHRRFTKSFIGAEALFATDAAAYTSPFAGYDLRKIATEGAMVIHDDNHSPGRVLTCATDMGIGRLDGRIISVNSPDRPADFSPRGLCCGFVQTAAPLEPGRVIQLKDKRRAIKVEIVDDIRPHRTARRPLEEMLQKGGRP